MSVLELGCGTGIYTRELSRRVKSVVACDISYDMLKQAPKLPNVTYAIADAHRPLTRDYQAVVGAYILQYLELDRAIPEYYRMLDNGGVVAFLEPCALNPYVYFATRTKIGKRLLHRPQDTTSFFPHELIGMFKRCGFKNIKIIPTEWHCGSIIIKARKDIVCQSRA